MGRNKKPKIDVKKYFDKKFRFTIEEKWKVPNDLFDAEKWYIETLQNKKIELNKVKELLGKYDLKEWSKHTKSRDPSTAVLNKLRHEYKLEFLTQAWCKFYEIIHSYPLINSLTRRKLVSLHLCEAPGAFVCSLNHYLAINYPLIEWKWTANALNPYYEGNTENEMIADDRFLRETLDNWDFGNDLTGDITNYANHVELIERFVNEKVMLITADGSVDCMNDPGNQENHVAHLHYCETITALRILNEGGCFLIKVFTMFEESTICLLYLLNCTFQEVNIFKPLTSKSGNSEVYVICLNYKGPEKITNWGTYLDKYKSPHLYTNKSLFKLEDLPIKFLNQIHVCSDYYMKLQIGKIKDNIESYGKPQFYAKRFKSVIADHFVEKYSLKDIPFEKRITTLNEARNKGNFEGFYSVFKNQNSFKLTIKHGKRFSKILHSKFCDNVNVIKWNFKGKNSDLYTLSLKSLAIKYNVINLTHHSITNVTQFHFKFLSNIKNCIDSNAKDLIIIGPFVTNIQVGIIYLLTNAYEISIFLKSGCVIFTNLTNSNKLNLLKQLNLIQDEHVKLNNHEYDLIQLVSINDLYRSGLISLLIEYNNYFVKYWHLN